MAETTLLFTGSWWGENIEDSINVPVKNWVTGHDSEGQTIINVDFVLAVAMRSYHLEPCSPSPDSCQKTQTFVSSGYTGYYAQGIISLPQKLGLLALKRCLGKSNSWRTSLSADTSHESELELPVFRISKLQHTRWWGITEKESYCLGVLFAVFPNFGVLFAVFLQLTILRNMMSWICKAAVSWVKPLV